MKHKTMRRIAAVLTFFVLWAVVETCVRFFTEPMEQSWPMVREDRKAAEGTIDTAFIGASLFRNGIIPAVVDQALGSRSFNYSTSSQTMELSYYALKDLTETNPVKLALIDISVNRLLADGEDGAYISKFVLLSHMINRKAQLELLWDCFTLDELPLIVLHSARDQMHFFVDTFGMRLKASYLRDYLKYGYVPDPTYPAGSMGYTPCYSAIASGNVPIAASLLDSAELDLNKDYNHLDQVIDLCKEKGITPILVSMPTTDAYMLALNQYEALMAPVLELARQKGTLVLDFNLSKFRVSKLTAANFADERHLNNTGAELFTPVLTEVLQKVLAGEDTSGYFYGTYGEMIRNIQRVASIHCKVEKSEGGIVLQASSLHGSLVTPSYRFFYRSRGETETENRLLESKGGRCDLIDLEPGVYTVRVEACSAPSAPCDVYSEKPITID